MSKVTAGSKGVVMLFGTIGRNIRLESKTRFEEEEAHLVSDMEEVGSTGDIYALVESDMMSGDEVVTQVFQTANGARVFSDHDYGVIVDPSLPPDQIYEVGCETIFQDVNELEDSWNTQIKLDLKKYNVRWVHFVP